MWLSTLTYKYNASRLRVGWTSGHNFLEVKEVGWTSEQDPLKSRAGGDLGTTPQGQDLGDLGARYLEVAGWRDLEAQRLKVGSGGHTQREKEEIQSIHHTHTTNI